MLSYERLGQYDEAFEACQRALRLALSIGREDTKFNAISNLGFVQMGVGLWTEALKYHEEALELARMHDNEYGLVICTANMAESYAALGDHQRAHLLFMEATAKARALGDLEHLVDILNEHAKLYVVAGDQGAATRLLEECLALVQQMGGFHRELTYRVHLAQLLAGMGRTPEALTALDVVPPSHAGALEARSQRLRLLAELHAERGHTELAETYQQQQRDAEQAMKDQAETWASLVPQVEEQVAHWKREAERTGQPRHDAPPDRTGAASPLDLTTLNHHFERAQQTLTDLAVLVIAADRPDRPEVSPALLHEEFRQLVGHLLRAEQPSTIDLGCRTDGSCMFVLPDTSPLAALSAARRVSASLRSGRPPTYAPVQVSVGCCTTTAWSQAEDMLRSAEHFLSQAQGLGGNRVIATGRGRS